MNLRLSTAMAHRSQQSGIDPCQPRQGPGIELIIFSAALADQSYLARMGHDHFVTHLCQLPADPGRVRSGFQCDPTARNPAERLADSVRCGRHVTFPNHLPRLIQNAVIASSISQVQPDRQPCLLENLLPTHGDGAILFHKPVSFALRLERVNPWERIASRRRPAFSSHLRNGVTVTWESSKSPMTRSGRIGTWPIRLLPFREHIDTSRSARSTKL